MRLSPQQIATIRQCVHTVAGEAARVDDNQRGGDVDLLLEIDTPVDEPAQLAARIAAQVSRCMHGRKVDVLVKAPNLLSLPIHAIALAQGVRL